MGSFIFRDMAKAWQGRACILCYHRIHPNSKFDKYTYPNGNIISESAFNDQMKLLSNEYDVISIDDMSNHLLSSSNDFKVAITFDDGYKDNLTIALPILKKYNIPATIYIVTRFPEGDTWMWWNEIWDCLINIKKLDICFMGKLKIYKIASINNKKKCFLELVKWILSLEVEDQKKLMTKISGNSKRRQYPELCLNWNDIKHLDSNRLITIGAHTHSHHQLKNLSYKRSFYEIKKSKEILEGKLSHKIGHFAYPFGGVNDFSKKDSRIVRLCGFDTAVTTIKKPINRYDRHSIPRILIQDYMSENGFKAVLSGWSNFLSSH